MMNAVTASPIELGARKRVLRQVIELDAVQLDTGTNHGWAHVAMLGTWEGHSKGSFTFSKDAFQQILRNFQSQANPIPWDYEHDTFNLATSGPKPAAGWVRKLQLRNNGTELWAYVDWTPRAADMIRAGEYRFCSPVVDFESIDRRTKEEIGAELLSVALTNNPFLDGQHPIQLTWVAAAAAPPPPTDEEKRRQQYLEAAEPKGPPQPPQQLPPNAEQKPMAAPPPPPPPPPAAVDPAAADAALGDGSEADANALITAFADAAGLDKSQTLAALLDLQDLIVNELQKTVARDGTPSETRRTMTVEKKPEPQAQPSTDNQPAASVQAAAPAGTTPPVSLDELERQRDKQQIAALTERLEKIEAERAAEKEAAIVALVDDKIRDGYVPPDQRDNAIWAFKADRKRAEQIYANKLIPIGVRQSTTPPAAMGGTGGAPAPKQPGQPIDMSQFSRQELLTIDCLMGAHKTQDEAIQIVLMKRGQN